MTSTCIRLQPHVLHSLHFNRILPLSTAGYARILLAPILQSAVFCSVLVGGVSGESVTSPASAGSKRDLPSGRPHPAKSSLAGGGGKRAGALRCSSPHLRERHCIVRLLADTHGTTDKGLPSARRMFRRRFKGVWKQVRRRDRTRGGRNVHLFHNTCPHCHPIIRDPLLSAPATSIPDNGLDCYTCLGSLIATGSLGLDTRLHLDPTSIHPSLKPHHRSSTRLGSPREQNRTKQPNLAPNPKSCSRYSSQDVVVHLQHPRPPFCPPARQLSREHCRGPHRLGPHASPPRVGPPHSLPPP